MKKHFIQILIASTLVGLTGCATLTKKFSHQDEKAKAAEAMTEDSPVVYQSGKRNAVISKYDRAHWVEVRKNLKGSDRKLYVTLATGEWDVAEEDARNFLKKNPRNLNAISVIALSLAMQGKYQLASFYAKQYEKFG